MTDDIVDQIAGVTPELDALRRRRPVTREQLQASFDALFLPVSVEHVSPAERELVAAFATALAGAEDATAAFYAARAQDAAPQPAAVVPASAPSRAAACIIRVLIGRSPREGPARRADRGSGPARRAPSRACGGRGRGGQSR